IYRLRYSQLSLENSDFFRTIDRVNYSAKECALRIDQNQEFRDMYKNHIKQDNDEILGVINKTQHYPKDKISDMRIYLTFYVSWVLSDDEISNKKEIFDEICNLIHGDVYKLLEIKICDKYTETKEEIEDTEKKLISDDNDKNKEEEPTITVEIESKNEDEIVDGDDSIENNAVDDNNGNLDKEEIDETEKEIISDDNDKNKEEEPTITVKIENKNENKDPVNNS
ncbi:MAG: hypothetical protein MHPSP_002561, partial [Paramarteilia canceri]